MKISIAEPKDKNQIKELWKKVLEHAFENNPQDKYHNPKDELVFKMKQLNYIFKSVSSRLYLAFVEDELIGTIAYGLPPNTGILSKTGKDLKTTPEIGSLYIDPLMQRIGYGKQLLIFILEELEKQGVQKVCFDSIIESSKRIWIQLFGKPTYMIKSKKQDFEYMIWVISVSSTLKLLKTRKS